MQINLENQQRQVSHRFQHAERDGYFLGVLAILLVAGQLCADEPIRFSATIDLGPDRGQSFGSIFEARDAKGRVVAGAGFMDAYNTRFRSDRHKLQFFIRTSVSGHGLDRLPHPDLDTGVYLFDIDEQIHAWTSSRGNRVRHLSASGWSDELQPDVKGIRGGDGVMRIGKGRLAFAHDKATYNDKPILDPPQEGRYYSFYYAHGRLFFYHTVRSDEGGFTKIYACPWTPEDEGKIDVSAATAMDAKYVGATPFAWGQFKDEVLTVSNYGGVYRFDGSEWKTLVEASDQVSYQVYSMLHFHDRLLLAQYPTGNLFEYKGGEVKHLENWPPRLPGVSGSAREAQTMCIYRGDLFVGVWPWAELWRYDRDADKWHAMGRAFTHPEITDKRTHPYEDEANKLKLVTNHWGQRITSMIPQGELLLLSTSSKGTDVWKDEYAFLSDARRKEYGAVLRMKMPGNLATQIEWKDGPTKLEFIVDEGRMSITQDGRELRTTRFGAAAAKPLLDPKTTWGKGVFGDFAGKLTSASAR